MQAERRSKPRMYDPISLQVRGIGENGEAYEFQTVTCNLGAGGVCAAAPRVLQPGEHLSFSIRFALAGSHPATAPEIAACGVVLRVEPESGNLRCVFAAKFQSSGTRSPFPEH